MFRQCATDMFSTYCVKCTSVSSVHSKYLFPLGNISVYERVGENASKEWHIRRLITGACSLSLFFWYPGFWNENNTPTCSINLFFFSGKMYKDYDCSPTENPWKSYFGPYSLKSFLALFSIVQGRVAPDLSKTKDSIWDNCVKSKLPLTIAIPWVVHSVLILWITICVSD